MDKGKKQDFTGAELLEVKKSRKADLEQNRTTWLLFGFVFALVCLFAGLELTEFQDKEEQPAPKSKSKDDIIVVVEEIPPLVIEKKVIPPPPQAKKIIDVIKVVEDEVDIEEQELVSVQDMSEFAEVEALDEALTDDNQKIEFTPVDVCCKAMISLSKNVIADNRILIRKRIKTNELIFDEIFLGDKTECEINIVYFRKNKKSAPANRGRSKAKRLTEFCVYGINTRWTTRHW